MDAQCSFSEFLSRACRHKTPVSDGSEACGFDPDKRPHFTQEQQTSFLQNKFFVADWDFGVCLQYECRRKQLRKPPELDSWIDLRATYRVSGDTVTSAAPFSFCISRCFLMVICCFVSEILQQETPGVEQSFERCRDFLRGQRTLRYCVSRPHGRKRGRAI